MKIIMMIACLVMAGFCHAENTYILKTDVYAWLLDENGNKVKSERIKSGTKITIVSDDAQTSSAKTGKEQIGRVNHIPPKTFMATKAPGLASKFVCTCTIYDYFNWEWGSCEKTHWSVRIKAYTSDREDWETFNGYVPKESQLGKRIFNILSDGKEHKLNLVLQYEKALDSSCVKIVDMSN